MKPRKNDIRSALLLSCILLALPARGEEPLWELGIGVSGISFADYIGSDKRTNWLLPFPYIIYRGEFLQIDREEVAGQLFENNRFDLDISLSGSLPVNSDNNDDRAGMPDLDPILEIGPTLQITLYDNAVSGQKVYFDLPIRAAIASDFTDIEFVGWVSNPSINYEKSFVNNSSSLKLDATFGPVFGNDEYHAYFYDVAPRFATAQRPQFQSGGGFGGWRSAVGFSRSRGNFWYGAFLRYIDISDAEFAASPLVKKDTSLMGGFAIAWIFARSKQSAAGKR